MKKWILGFGVFALVFAMLAVPMDFKVQAEESTTVSGSDAGTVSDGNAGSTTTTTKLEAPTGLTWDGWKTTWNPVENAKMYIVNIYKDGKHAAMQILPGASAHEYDYSNRIADSGVYTFRVTAYSESNIMKADKAVSEYSVEKTYIRPEKELGMVVGTWDSEREGIFKVPVMEGVGRFFLDIYYVAEGTTKEHGVASGNVPVDEGVGVMEIDLSSVFKYHGAGKYRVRVQALSADVDAVANGVIGDFSAYYDSAATLTGIKKQLNEYMAAGTAAEAKLNIMANISQANLSTAMQTDAEVLETIKQLEEKYAAEKGITVTSTAVSEEAGKYVKAEEINVVGAGLNGKDGETVKLEVSVPEKKETEIFQYPNSVQLDIKLLSNSTSIHKLDIPITITMKVPAGIDVKRLVILHYCADGNCENITPKVVNGDGTITFTVTEFSTFVFAEKAGGNTGSGEAQQPQDEEEENDDDDEEEVKEEKSATPAKDNVPKTGDSLPIALPMTAAVCLAGAAVILKKKEN